MIFSSPEHEVLRVSYFDSAVSVVHCQLSIFSSPELKVVMVSFCDRPMLGVRRASSTISLNIS